MESGDWQFYGLVTDMHLVSTDPRFAEEKHSERWPSELAALLNEQTLATHLEVLPSLMLERGPEPGSKDYESWQDEIEKGLRPHPRVLPVKTIPVHHAPVRMASPGDIAEVFGKEDNREYFVIGHTREQGHPVCINLRKFIQRSSGIFGATGTGKSFLTRMTLAGLIQSNAASVLVLDMHNEYGFDDTASDTGLPVAGLKTKFPARTRVVGLGSGASIRGNIPDFNLEIPYKAILPEDILLLSRALNLRETTPTTLDALVKDFGRAGWFQAFREMKVGAKITIEDGKEIVAPDSVESWANRAGVHVSAAEALHTKLGRLFRKPYLLEEPARDGIQEIIHALNDHKHVVLSFGRFESDLDYLLVSNVLTRRIRAEWEERTNHFRTSGQDEPRQLVIVLEEAHKLLNREMASQTTFSVIAREMRKYYVTLLIVDQRPSQIYDEVMSQLGTRVSGWLGDEDDIRAVLSGLAGRQALRGMLSRLQPAEEVLLLGWGVKMPLPIRSRRYDESFWEDLQGGRKKVSDQSAEESIRELGF
jgi:DNA helicase HerA-like ATPase